MAELKDLQTDLDAIAQLRAKYNAAKEVSDNLKAELDLKREQMLFTLHANKVKTFKNDKLTVSVAERHDIKIVDPEQVMSWIAQNLPDPDTFLTVDPTRFKPLAMANFQATGEIPQGTEHVSTEYLSLRSNNG